MRIREATSGIVAVAVAAGAMPLGAQDVRPPMHGWVSVGLGAATAGLAGDIGGTLTSGHTAYSINWSGASGVFGGEDREDLAVLVGRRTSNPYVFLVGGIGPSWARAYPISCIDPCDRVDAPRATVAVAAFGQAIVATPVLGVSLGAFGVLGPRHVSYAGAVVSLCLGWFGEGKSSSSPRNPPQRPHNR